MNLEEANKLINDKFKALNDISITEIKNREDE